MKDMQVVKAIIAPKKDVASDIQSNSPWIISSLLAIMAYVALSSFLMTLFESEWGWLKSLYFTVINMTTVGFGEVVPSTDAGRALAMVNSIIGLVLFGFLVAVITIALQKDEPTPSIDIDELIARLKKESLIPSTELHEKWLESRCEVQELAARVEELSRKSEQSDRNDDESE